MFIRIIILTLILGQSSQLISQSRQTRLEYIDTFAKLAMSEMKRTGIPASITLAQGCLESDDGNSRLAINANNHFGIKCHDWDGAKIYHDDDEHQECFRKYESAYDSYMDHSQFLMSKGRYAFLFDLKHDNYRGWARGLKKAGYATSSRYGDLLIAIIEDNELHKYDRLVLSGEFEDEEAKSEPLINAGREVLMNNRIEYVIVQAGDTPSMLRDELDLYPHELYRYNDLPRNSALKEGMIIYLQPKRNKAEKGSDTHIVQEDESMWDISQTYGIKLNRLRKSNGIPAGVEPKPGTELRLRSNKHILPISDPQQENGSPDDEEMEFQFDGS